MRRRRANNEGSITFHKATGRWQARISLGDGTRKAVYGKTEAEAAAKLAAMKAALCPAAPAAAERDTLITIETGDHLTTIRWTLEGVEIAHPSSRSAAEVVGDVLELFEHLAAVTAAAPIRSVSRG